MSQNLLTAMDFLKHLVWQNVRTWIQVTDAELRMVNKCSDLATVCRIWDRPEAVVAQAVASVAPRSSGSTAPKALSSRDSTDWALIVYNLFVVLLPQEVISCALGCPISLQCCHLLGTSLD